MCCCADAFVNIPRRRRAEKRRARKAQGRKGGSSSDDDSDGDDRAAAVAAAGKAAAAGCAAGDADDPFNDPFFQVGLWFYCCSLQYKAPHLQNPSSHLAGFSRCRQATQHLLLAVLAAARHQARIKARITYRTTVLGREFVSATPSA